MNWEFLQTILVICIILLVIYYIARNIYINSLDTLPIGQLYDIVEPGDLILFRWHEVDPLHQMFSIFTHVGMVIQLNNKLYILETHLAGDTKHMGYEGGGVNLYNLNERLLKYQGYNYLLKMKPQKNPSKDINKKIVDKLAIYKQIPFKNDYKNFYKNKCIPRFIYDKDDHITKVENSMCCSEFIGYLLQDLNILDPSIKTDCFTPETFVNLSNTSGKIYKGAIKIEK